MATSTNKGNKGKKTGSIFKEVERNRQGKVVRTYYVVRRRWTDLEGKRREKKRVGQTYREALDLEREIKDEIEQELSPPAEGRTDKTFGELAAKYKKEYLVPPRYVGGKKVEGLRSHEKLETFYRPLVEHFGGMRLGEIGYETVKGYKHRRLNTAVVVRRRDRKTKQEFVERRQRSVAAVNRELQLLRRILNVGVQWGWLASTPFRAGDPLVVTAHEARRMRVLTREEEAALLQACGERLRTYTWRGRTLTAVDRGGRRAHLRAAVVCALDTALRANEQFTLTRGDVLLDERVIHVREYNAKAARERLVPVSERLHAELVKIFERLPDRPDARVFAHARLKGSFAGACRAAGIDGFRWHDMRHTAIMWMLEAGMPEAEVMKITGHTSWTTFMRYVSLNKERTRAAAAMLDARRALVEREAREKQRGETVH